MNNLIEKLEQAPEGSRELDVAIWNATCADNPLARVTTLPAGHHHYTTSIDAALTLVPEGWMIASISKFIRRGEKRSGVMLIRTGDAEKQLEQLADPWGALPRTEASTPALALCIAALKARE